MILQIAKIQKLISISKQRNINTLERSSYSKQTFHEVGECNKITGMGNPALFGFFFSDNSKKRKPME